MKKLFLIFILIIITCIICSNILTNMQLHIWIFDSLKNNAPQKISDIKDNIFNISLFFRGLFLLRQGAKAKATMNEIIKKII